MANSKKTKRSSAGSRVRKSALVKGAEQYNVLPGYDAIATAQDCYWHEPSALHAIKFIESMCRYAMGERTGQRFQLLPWQRAFVANLYGWLRPDGSRRYRQAHLLVPRKSGKTELAAALALYHLLADDEPTPEVVGIARDREQARLCFQRAKRMVEQEPKMRERCEYFQTRITSPQTHGVYKVLSSDAPGAHGLNVSACIADEVHAMENRRDLWEAVMTSMGTRRQPLMVSITTAGTLRESLEFDLFQYARKICDQTVDNMAFLPCLYFAEESSDWNDPKVWQASNPSLGYTVNSDWYATEAKRAVDQPSYETAFRTYYLCQHVTTSARWIRMSDWDACSAEFDDNVLSGLPCYLGLDLGQTTDLSSLSAVWIDGDVLYVRNYNYAPEEGAIARARRDGVPYLDWSRNGWLTLTPGDATDYAYIREQVLQLASKHRVRLVGYDPYNAQNIGNELDAKGIKVVRVPQSYLNLSTPTRMWERAIVNKTLQHDGNPVLSWAMSNVVVEQDFAGNARPSKRRSVERIDPVVASIVAISASLHDERMSATPYDNRGLIWL